MFLFLSFVLAIPQLASATEEYAKQTGQTCDVCHLDPNGGGVLTPVGRAFADSHKARTENPEKWGFIKGARLVIGYIHFLAAIFWFGTILYVHLVLKPAYAASGLPRGEVRVGDDCFYNYSDTYSLALGVSAVIKFFGNVLALHLLRPEDHKPYCTDLSSST